MCVCTAGGGHSESVWIGGRGAAGGESESREGVCVEGGQSRERVQHPDSLVDKAVPQSAFVPFNRTELELDCATEPAVCPSLCLWCLTQL